MTRPGQLDPDIVEKPIPCSRCERLERSLDSVLEQAHDMEGQYKTLLGSAQHLLDLQGADGNWDYDPYMLGMYNGMELLLSLMECREPEFRDPPDTWGANNPEAELEVAE